MDVVRHGVSAHVARIGPLYVLTFQHMRSIGHNAGVSYTVATSLLPPNTWVSQENRVGLLVGWIESGADSYARRLIDDNPPLDFKTKPGLRDSKRLFAAVLSREDITALPGIYAFIIDLVHDKAWLPHWIGLVNTRRLAEHSVALVAQFARVPASVREGELLPSEKVPSWGHALWAYWSSQHRGKLIFQPVSDNIFNVEWDALDNVRYWFSLVGMMPRHTQRVLLACVECLSSYAEDDPNVTLRLIRFCREEAGLDYEQVPLRLLIKAAATLQGPAFRIWAADLLDTPGPWSPKVHALIDTCRLLLTHMD
jgi:hypothetical protein